VVDELEERYPLFDGLNLSFETREGILKHCSRANARTAGGAEPGGVGRRFLDRTQPGLEAQLCNLADEIAYNAHDIDDGVRSGLITLEQLAARCRCSPTTATRRWPSTRTCRAAGCCTKRSAAC
jgi:dGTPase